MVDRGLSPDVAAERVIRIPVDAAYPDRVIRIDKPTYDVPSGTSHPEYSIPNEVIDAIVMHYGLNEPGNVIYDPMLGGATTLSRLLALGCQCEGAELDPGQFAIAQQRLPEDVNILLGDCTKTATPMMNRGYPFVWCSPGFRDLYRLTHEKYDSTLAHAFIQMLAPNGKIFIDSAFRAQRDGRQYYPVQDTLEYFVNPTGSYFSGWFNVDAIHPFEVINPPEGCDTDVAVIVLSLRFPTQYSLADIALARHRPLF